MGKQKSEVDEQISELTRVELFAAIQQNKAKRNACIFFGGVTVAIFLFLGWSNWTLIIPALLGMAALLFQANIAILSPELKRRSGAHSQDQQDTEVSENSSDHQTRVAELEDHATYIVNKLKIKMLQIESGELVEDSEIAALEKEADRISEELEIARLKAEVNELNMKIRKLDEGKSN